MLRKILKLSIILIISILIGNMAYGIYRESEISDEPNRNILNNVENVEDNNEMIEKNGIQGKVIIESITEQYEGYKVSSKLEIPKIKLDTYVLEDESDEAMWLCPTKYFGPEPNEAGNYCIAAHNYDKENMFNHIIELEVGDLIFLSDNKNGKVEYEVYDIYKVKPTNNEPLSQQTNGNTEITLITCSDYSSTRIIVKARKI